MKTLYASKVSGTVRIPASKSQTIRACLIALAARGISKIRNPLMSQDTKSCMSALEALGCRLFYDEEMATLMVDSRDLPTGGDVDIDTGNSGTTTYLLYGLLGTLARGTVTLHGDGQLNRRPIRALAEAYGDLGLSGECTGDCPPVRITGTLKGGRTSIECPTSQYLSSLLLSLPLASGESEVVCPLLYEKPYVRMTLDWLDRQGIEYWISEDLQHLKMPGGQHYRAIDEEVAGDWSSASFFFAAAAITGSRLTVRGLDLSDSQGDKRLLNILEEMGCKVERAKDGIAIEGPERLKGGTFDINDIPDCLPILSVLGAVTSEPLVLTNVANARIKETDRIHCMVENMRLLGLEAEEVEDGLTIKPGKLRGGITVPCYGDHRIIMATAILSLVADEGLTIDDEGAAAVTFPTFFTLLESIKENN